MMSKELTEKWKNGVLPIGHYYVKRKNFDKVFIDNTVLKFDEIPVTKLAWSDKTDEVLAPVPSYDHFSQLVKKVEQLQEQLNTATRALKGISVWANTGNGGKQAVKNLCEQALKEMGVK